MNQPLMHTLSARCGRVSLLRRGAAVLAIAGSVLVPVLASAPAQAAKAKVSTGIEPWQGRRVLLLLPLQLGEGFNADRAFGQAILTRAESLLQQQLQATGKFSVIQAHRFSPLVQRGLQEKRLTEAQVEDFLKAQTLENANTFLNQFVFERPAMIADFRLEEVRAVSGAKQPSVQVQVSGRLYDAGNPVAVKSPVFTSEPARAGRNNIERFLAAADNAFMQAAAELVAPLEDIQLPSVEPVAPTTPGAPTDAAAPTTPGTNTVAPTVAPVAPTTLPGDRPITGSSSASSAGSVPQLPPAQPPLGINVPNAPAPR